MLIPFFIPLILRSMPIIKRRQWFSLIQKAALFALTSLEIMLKI